MKRFLVSTMTALVASAFCCSTFAQTTVPSTSPSSDVQPVAIVPADSQARANAIPPDNDAVLGFGTLKGQPTGGVFQLGKAAAPVDKAAKLAPLDGFTIQQGNVATTPATRRIVSQRAAQAKAGGYVAKDTLTTGGGHYYGMKLWQADGQYYLSSLYNLDDTVKVDINLANGTVSIQPQKLITNNTYGDIYAVPINISGSNVTYSMQSPLTGTIDDRGVITMNPWGIVSTTGDYAGHALGLMTKSEWVPANAHASIIDRDSTRADWDVLIDYEKDNAIRIYNFANLGAPIAARLDASHRVRISPQFVYNLTLYGDFYIYKADFDRNAVNSTANIEGVGTDSTITIGSWVLGLSSSPSTTLMRVRQMVITSYDKLTYPERVTANFEGNGTASSPYLIKTAKDFVALSQSVADGNIYNGRYFRQANDIDMGTLTTNIVPIGDPTNQFSATFDGGGHTISNLSIDGQGFNYVGLFGVCTSACTIKNVNLTNAKVTGSGNYIAPLVAYTFGKVIDSHVQGNVVSTNIGAGGVVGNNYGGSLSGLSFSGKISGYGYTGGVVGHNYGTVTNCHSDGDVSLDGTIEQIYNRVGGVVGFSQSLPQQRTASISNSYFSGRVTQNAGYGFAGGVVGYLHNSDLTQSFNVGSVRNTARSNLSEYAGGVAGVTYNSTVKDCFNAGTIEEVGSSTGIGGIVGYLSCTYSSVTGIYDNSTIENCYNSGAIIGNYRTDNSGVFGSEFTSAYDTQVPSDSAFTHVYSDLQATGVIDDPRGVTTSSLTSGTLPEGFSSSVWTAEAGKYPVLKALSATDESKLASSNVLFADGQSTRVMKNPATLRAAQGCQWTLRSNNANVNQTATATISGNTLSVRDSYGTDTLAVYNGSGLITRYYAVTMVPKVFDGDGTEASPYLIKNKEDFVKFDNAINNYDHRGDYFKLTADVDFNFATDFAGVAAGDHLHRFAGTFDGDNHTLHHLAINAVKRDDDGKILSGTYNYGGLFHIGTATSCIKNVKIADDCDLNFYSHAGAIIGYTEGRVENCYNYANINEGQRNIGGIVGYLAPTGVVTGCYNSGKLDFDGYYAGGIVGYNAGSVQYSENDGDIHVTDDNGHVGGIGGVSLGTADNCVNNGYVYGYDYVGGLFGAIDSEEGTTNLTNSVNSGMIGFDASATRIGGIVGYTGLVGTVSNNYYDESIVPNGPSATLKNGMTGLSTSELIAGKSLTGLAADKWSLTTGAYPVLKAFAQEKAAVALRNTYVNFGPNAVRTNVVVNTPLATSSQIEWKLTGGHNFAIDGTTLKVTLPDGVVASDTLTATYAKTWVKTYYLKSIPNILEGSGTEASPFAIRTVADLNKLSSFIQSSGMEYDGYYFRVENDIQYADTDTLGIIASGNINFQGDFDGNGKTISGYNYENIVSKTGRNLGFFGNVGSNGRIHDLTLDGTFKGYQYVGGFVGKLYGTLENCVLKGTTLSQSSYCGGLVGQSYDGSIIRHCYNRGHVATDVTRSNVAGIVANMNQGARVDSCANEGIVGFFADGKGSSSAAGIAAASRGTISNSWNAGSVLGGSNKAGILSNGQKDFALINCHNDSTISSTAMYTGGVLAESANDSKGLVKGCYNTAKIYGERFVGGVVGFANRGLTIDSCYNTADITATYFAVGGVLGQGNSASEASPIIVRNSWNSGNVTSANFSVGGVVGKMSGNNQLINSYNTGNVTVNKEAPSNSDSGVGGLIGSMCGVIDSCWNAGNVVSNIQGVGGICGTGAMPIAQVSNTVNLGNVTVTAVNPDRDYNVGGIWGGYGPAVITNCYNMGTLTAPSNIAGINGGMYTNSRGGSQVINSYNAGRIVATESGDGCANVAVFSTASDSAQHVVQNSYYDTTIGNDVWSADSRATGLTSAQLFEAALGDAYVEQRACYPTLAAFQHVTQANFAAASLLLQDGDTPDNVTKAFYVGIPEGVEWTSSSNLTIDNEGVVTATATGEAWVKATDTKGLGLEKTFNLIIKKVTDGIDVNIAAGKAVSDVEYYDISGCRVSRPVPGTIYILKTNYDDGTMSVTKQVYRK